MADSQAIPPIPENVRRERRADAAHTLRGAFERMAFAEALLRGADAEEQRQQILGLQSLVLDVVRRLAPAYPEAMEAGADGGTIPPDGVEKVIYPVATRSWHTTARVRMRRDYSCASVDPYLTAHFRAGQELELVQWGNAGQLVKRKSWWTGYDIDGAFIVPAGAVEIVEVLEHVGPFDEDEQT